MIGVISDDELKGKVDKLSSWKKILEECKVEIEKLESEFEVMAAQDMKDRKIKQIKYLGTDGATVTVTSAESVKVVYHSFLRKILGTTYGDVAKEKVTYDYAEPFKTILKALYKGEYVDVELDEVLESITHDPDVIAALKKKLRGKWDKDIENIKNIAGLSQKDAEYYEYFIIESLNYEKIQKILEAAGHKKGSESYEAALQTLINSVEVDDVLKVGIK